MKLQLRIWKPAIPPPRKVTIQAYAYPPLWFNNQILGFKSSEEPPNLLRACSISRQVILSCYSTCFESERKIRLDGEHDTLILLNSQLVLCTPPIFPQQVTSALNSFANVTTLCLVRVATFNAEQNFFATLAANAPALRIFIVMFPSRPVDGILDRTGDRVIFGQAFFQKVVHSAPIPDKLTASFFFC
jgi:hypothetical protein